MTKKKPAMPFEALSELAQEMARAAVAIELFPEDTEYTLQQLDVLEDLRGQGLKLARECEAIFEAPAGAGE